MITKETTDLLIQIIFKRKKQLIQKNRTEFLDKKRISDYKCVCFLPGEDPEAIELNDKKTKSKKDDEKEEKEEDNKMKKKEQSVLQAKLTKLAIQIGYAG